MNDNLYKVCRENGLIIEQNVSCFTTDSCYSPDILLNDDQNDTIGAIFENQHELFNDVIIDIDDFMGDHSVNCDSSVLCDIVPDNDGSSEYDETNNCDHLCSDKCESNNAFNDDNTTTSNTVCFKIGCLNVRSLYPKLEEVTTFLTTNHFDIFGINESWLDSSFSDKNVEIDGYDIYRKDRNRHGGGVCIYVKSHLECKIIHDDNVEIESLWLTLTINSKEFIIGTVYRPPNANIVYNEQILDEIERLKNLYEHMILLGDLNYDCSHSSSNFVNELEELFCMTQLVNEPTRETLTSSSIIDIILTTVPEQHISTNVLKVSMSDHYCIQTILQNVNNLKTSHNLITFKDYKCFVKQNFIQDISNAFHDGKLMGSNVLDLWINFKMKFLEISDKHVPLVTRRMKKRFKPWVTHDIIQMMYKRDYLKKLAIKTGCQIKWNEYRSVRNKITFMIKKGKKEYFHKESLQCKNDPKSTWKLINKVLNNRNNVSPPTKLTAKDFNDYFSTIGENTAKEYFINDNDGSHPWKGPNFTTTEFKFIDIQVDSVLKLLKGLGEYSNCDILGFDSKLLYYSAEIIAPYISLMINLSFQEGCVVDDWKISKVTPIFKGGDDKFSKTNYRPISVISHIAKVVEKVVQRQIMQYLMENDLVCVDQSAYRRYHNTQTSLHKCTEDWIDNICDKEYTAVCFLDIRKCFDTIDHKILLTKLSRYGINDLEALWFSSYLRNRSQFVKCNGEISSKCHVPIGVPQGSVLGPILFSLFVNDISSHVYPCSVNLYADDTLLYCTGHDVTEATEKLQVSLNEVSKWYNGNRLALNADKSKCMVIASKHQTRNECIMNVSLNNTTMEQVKNVKYLGVIIDSNLTWNDHVSTLCKNLSYKVSQLSRSRNIVTKEMMLTIYNSIIQPTIDYAITVWGHTTMTNINKIQRLQNLSARIIVDNFDYINVRGVDLVKELKWMNVSERIKYFEQLLMFKCIHGMAPDYLCDQVTMEIDIRNVVTRSHDMNMHVPFPKNEFARKSVFYSGAKNWNSLSGDNKDTASIDCFKRKLKRDMHNM